MYTVFVAASALQHVECVSVHLGIGSFASQNAAAAAASGWAVCWLKQYHACRLAIGRQPQAMHYTANSMGWRAAFTCRFRNRVPLAIIKAQRCSESLKDVLLHACLSAAGHPVPGPAVLDHRRVLGL